MRLEPFSLSTVQRQERKIMEVWEEQGMEIYNHNYENRREMKSN